MRTMLALVAVAATLAATADATSSKVFVSKRYGYSIVLPADWTSRPAVSAWTGGPPFLNQAQADIYEAGDGRALAVAAKSLAKTTTLKKWASSYVGTALPSFCRKSAGYRTTTLGGVPALAYTGRCDVHDVTIELTVRHSRGYVLGLASPTDYPAAADARVFETARRSFRFAR